MAEAEYIALLEDWREARNGQQMAIERAERAEALADELAKAYRYMIELRGWDPRGDALLAKHEEAR